MKFCPVCGRRLARTEEPAYCFWCGWDEEDNLAD